MISEYENECIFLLGMEIFKMFSLEKQEIFVDIYYEKIKQIYADYKKYDNINMSLLESIHKYIDNNNVKIWNIIKDILV